MKKNRMMRVASGLMVAVLMTTSAVSGTFAKYVTSASKSDEARVAKFGVEIYSGGYLFDDHDPLSGSYADADSITVQADTEHTNVVAPGTQHLSTDITGEEEDCLYFGVRGKPEVDVQISFTTNAETQDISMSKVDGYLDFTTSDIADDTISQADIPDGGYYPIHYQLENRVWDPSMNAGTGGYGPWAAVEGYGLADGKKLSDIVAYFTTTPVAVAANTDLSTAFGEYRISWKWGYPDGDTVESAIDATDKLDTYLGMKAANDSVAVPAGGTVNLNALINIKITVTQVD